MLAGFLWVLIGVIVIQALAVLLLSGLVWGLAQIARRKAFQEDVEALRLRLEAMERHLQVVQQKGGT